jgi:hypothetical protein
MEMEMEMKGVEYVVRAAFLFHFGEIEDGDLFLR